ncbi:hypothetical protein EIP86_007398 [Pleurotus ostreatoroseus]|nr:hypothetical protein EIP86_007398 [Pleurotus ostreatoroseus]
MDHIVAGVSVHGPEDETTDFEDYIIAIGSTQANATSPATDRPEAVGGSSEIITSAMPTEYGESEIHPRDRSGKYFIDHAPSHGSVMYTITPFMAHCNQDNDNDDTMQNSGNAAVDATANEADVTSHAIVEAENANGLSQASAAAVPDELHDHEALSDDMGKCDAFPEYEIRTIIRFAATDVNDPEDEDGGTTPRDHDMASPIARSTENDDDDASP